MGILGNGLRVALICQSQLFSTSHVPGGKPDPPGFLDEGPGRMRRGGAGEIGKWAGVRRLRHRINVPLQCGYEQKRLNCCVYLRVGATFSYAKADGAER